MEAVEGDSPEQRDDDEDAAVGGEHAPELVAGLKRGDDTVRGQGHRAECDERDAFVVFDADPDEVGAADLGDGGGDEERDGAGGHAAIVPAGPLAGAVESRLREAMAAATAAAVRCNAATAPASTANPFSLMSAWWRTSRMSSAANASIATATSVSRGVSLGAATRRPRAPAKRARRRGRTATPLRRCRAGAVRRVGPPRSLLFR